MFLPPISKVFYPHVKVFYPLLNIRKIESEFKKTTSYISILNVRRWNVYDGGEKTLRKGVKNFWKWVKNFCLFMFIWQTSIFCHDYNMIIGRWETLFFINNVYWVLWPIYSFLISKGRICTKWVSWPWKMSKSGKK